MVNYNPKFLRFDTPNWYLTLPQLQTLVDSAVSQIKADESSFARSRKPSSTYQTQFKEICRDLSKASNQAEVLPDAHVVSQNSNGKWSSHPTQFYDGILGGLEYLSNFSGSHPVAAHHVSLRRNVMWRRDLNLRLAQVVCPAQEKYFETGDKMFLQPLSIRGAASDLGVDRNSLVRANYGLLFEINGSVPKTIVRASDLLPDRSLDAWRLEKIMLELSSYNAFFQDKGWVATSDEIRVWISHHYGVDYSVRVISKYKARISNKNAQGRREPKEKSLA